MMTEPKFMTGDTVSLISRLDIPGKLGRFKVVRPLPIEQGMHGYRVQSLTDGHLRVVRESEITFSPR